MSTTEHGAIWRLERDDAAERQFVERHDHVDEITVGTILEYDDWQWALVSELALDRDEPMVDFVLLDEVDDFVVQRLEAADGCRQHYAAVEHLRGGEHEYWAPVDYVLTDDVWNVLGPTHPEFRDGEPEPPEDYVANTEQEAES